MIKKYVKIIMVNGRVLVEMIEDVILKTIKTQKDIDTDQDSHLVEQF